MVPSGENPIYTVFIVASGTKYDVSGALTSIDMTDEDSQLAQTATINLMNVKTGGSWLSDLINVRDRVYIYANDGSQNAEVFRGIIWTRSKKTSLTERDIKLKCYDNLIYWQESQDSVYFSSGKSTKDVVSTLGSKWGVTIDYQYQSITHSKLALRGTLSDIFMGDILDLVKDRTGKKYVVKSVKDTVVISEQGKNTTVYQIKDKKNAIGTTVETTMDGMVTKVVILGKADENEREPVEATVSGDTGKYGTIQKLIDRDENTSLADAKKEAQSIIDADGTPKEEYSIQAPDIPWIRKGDQVQLDTVDLKGTFYVKSIDRAIDNQGKKMNLTVEKP